MDSVQIHLQPYNQTFTLSKEVITQFLPQSLFAQALEDDPNATVINITNPVVTPEAMQTILNYTQGMEPVVANPELAAVDRYLNIPWLKYYADPLYNQIRRPINTRMFTKYGNFTPEELVELNWPVLIEALNRGSSIAEYLRDKGMDLGGALVYARIQDLYEVTSVINLMVTPFNLDPKIIDAVSSNNLETIRTLLLKDTSQTSIDAAALIAAYDESYNILRWILQNFGFFSPQIRHDVGRALVIWSQIYPDDIEINSTLKEYLMWLITHWFV